jgi:nucleoside-diphosphate kinase
MKERERTFLMVKPDGVQRGLVGNIINRIESRGLKIAAMKMMVISKELAASHYGEHKDKPFYGELIEFITSAPVVAMICEGDNAVEMVRTMMGVTDPLKASPGTMRGDFAVYMGKNIVHGSDSQESAAREINLFFQPEEIYSYTLPHEGWLYD